MVIHASSTLLSSLFIVGMILYYYYSLSNFPRFTCVGTSCNKEGVSKKHSDNQSFMYVYIFPSHSPLALPSLRTFVIDPSENIQLSLLRIVDAPFLNPICREEGQNHMSSLDFPALVNFLYNKNGISNGLLLQAYQHRQIIEAHPDPDYYVDNIYEGHVCHQVEELTEELIAERERFIETKWGVNGSQPLPHSN